jgi:hypothetical protein
MNSFAKVSNFGKVISEPALGIEAVAFKALP